MLIRKCLTGVAFTIASTILINNFSPAFSEPKAKTDVKPEAWQEQHGTKTFSGVLEKNIFPGQDWWKQFNDAKLNGYVSDAFSNNFSLKTAIDRINESKEIVAEVKSIQRPYISLGAGSQHLRSISQSTGALNTLNLYDMPLQASFELDLFGKNKLKVESVQKIEEEQIKENEISRLTISSEVTAAYFNLIESDALIKTSQDLIDDLNQSLKLRQMLYEGGVIAYDDVFLTEKNLSQAKESLTEFLNQRDTFAHQLCVLRGIKPQSEKYISRASIDELNIPPNIPVGIPSALITHRPDVVEAELALEKLHIDVNEARKEFLPSINLTGAFGFASDKLSNLFNWGNDIFQLGGGLLQPLYTGGYNTAKLKYEKALAEEKLHNYYSVLLTSFKEVEDSLALFKNHYNDYQEMSSEIGKDKHYVDLAQIRVNAGFGTRLDYLDTKRQLLSDEILVQQNKIKSMIDIISLYKALGGGYGS